MRMLKLQMGAVGLSRGFPLGSVLLWCLGTLKEGLPHSEVEPLGWVRMTHSFLCFSFLGML